jgi:hypothetical protein
LPQAFAVSYTHGILTGHGDSKGRTGEETLSARRDRQDDDEERAKDGPDPRGVLDGYGHARQRATRAETRQCVSETSAPDGHFSQSGCGEDQTGRRVATPAEDTSEGPRGARADATAGR